jgi:hypothetical protein
MLTIETDRPSFRSLPALARAGLAVLAFGGLADLVAHLGLPAEAGHGHGFTAAEVEAHLVVFVGMVLILLGVVIDGVRRAHLGRSAGNRKGGM